MQISKFPEILGELSMYKHCVPGSFLSAHAREPGNEARALVASYPGFFGEEKQPGIDCLRIHGQFRYISIKL